MPDSSIRTLTNPPYRLGGSFGIITAMDVRQWWGLRRGRAALRLPVIPPAAFEGESVIGPPGATIQTAIVSLDHLTSEAGRPLLQQYLDELPRFIAAHDVTIDRSLLMDCLSWSLLMTIADESAPGGSRFLDSYELLGLERFGNTVAALQAPHRAGAPAVVLASDDMVENDRYLPMAHFMAVDETSVTLEYHDLDDDDDEGRDALHRVIVDRAPFARRMAELHDTLQGLVHGVSGALGVRAW